jgi:hypothetical protein
LHFSGGERRHTTLIDSKTALKEEFLKTLTFLSVIVATAIANGIALTVLWGWFVAEPFGIRYIDVPTAIGISLIVRYLAGGRKTDDDMSFGKAIAYAISMPFVILLFGWVIHLFQ